MVDIDPRLFAFLENPLVLLLSIVWSLVWKGLSLWKAAKNNQKYWFIALLIINALGILEIIYLLIFAPKKTKKSS